MKGRLALPRIVAYMEDEHRYWKIIRRFLQVMSATQDDRLK
jgi:hypothetical protein